MTNVLVVIIWLFRFCRDIGLSKWATYVQNMYLHASDCKEHAISSDDHLSDGFREFVILRSNRMTLWKSRQGKNSGAQFAHPDARLFYTPIRRTSRYFQWLALQ